LSDLVLGVARLLDPHLVGLPLVINGGVADDFPLALIVGHDVAGTELVGEHALDMMTRMAAMPTVSQALQQFAQEHHHHGDLVGNADAATAEGYRFWVRCACGERFERWVTEARVVEDLVRSGLLALEN
jgi:hypothetical protein